jgi:hypothetical protein
MREEIEQTLAEAKGAVLLISADFITGDSQPLPVRAHPAGPLSVR